MASSTSTTRSPTIKRILKEASELAASPSAEYHAAPLDSNLFEWHFTLRGPPAPSPYATGLYHGRIVLPPTYPLRPPSFRFLTPSGRFEVNREICLSISGHHEETWQPAWGLRTALVALRAFMDGEAKGQVGGVEAGREVRVRLAGESGRWRCAGCGGLTNREIIEEQERTVAAAGSEATEGKVPEELRLEYKDELPSGKEKERGEEDSDASRGKEASAAVVEPQTMPAVSVALPESPSSPVQPRSPSSQRTTTVTTANSSPPSSPRGIHQQQLRRRQITQVVPRWVDMAICGIAAALAVMLIKKILYVFS